MQGLLDSGASRTILGRVGWEAIKGLHPPLRETEEGMVRVADGRSCRVLGETDLPVELDGRVKVIPILVVPSLERALYLGIDFWKAMRFVPDVAQGTWTFSDSVKVPVVAECKQVKDRLTTKERNQLEKMADAMMALPSGKLGSTDLVHHKIETGDAAPIKQRYYPFSPVIQKQINKELDDMLKDGIVEPSTSAWSSPIILVKKPATKTFRVCIDFRKVNAVTKRDAYPLPYVSGILDQLRNAKYMTSLDLKTAYWQVPLEEESKEKTAFAVPGRGLFQFRRMPMGLHNSPATWQRLIDRVLGPELDPHVFVYLDDVMIVTPTFETHFDVLQKVLQKLKAAGLTLNKEKCVFGRSELKYLGYIVDEDGLRVNPEKVTAILNYPRPRNVTEVKRFIGLASWYRRFVPDFATKMAPLNELTKGGRKGHKNPPWEWGETQDLAFRQIKMHLVEAPLLTCPDFNRPFLVQTDASTVGLGAVISQIFEEGEKVIAYASRSLTKSERIYTTTELECLAVVWAVEKFRPYLEGTPFTVITDHHSLIWLHNLKDPRGRLARWAVRLQQYSFEILHRPGRNHAVPDALSRAVVSVEAIVITKNDHDDWYKEQLRKVLESPSSFPNWKGEGGKLWKRLLRRRKQFLLAPEDEGWRLVVPRSLRKKVLEEGHDQPTAGHLGTFKTIKRISEQYYWPGMASDISRHVRQCTVCQSLKPVQQLPAGMMGSQRIVDNPWQMVSTDLMGPFPMSSKQNRFLLVIADCFTKYTLLFPLRTATAEKIAQIIEQEVFLVFGAPQYVICDNGTQYTSKRFVDKVTEYGGKILYNPNYHPQANPTERINRVLKTMIASYVKDNHRSWDKNLPQLRHAICTATHEATGFTPAFLNFGRELHLSGTSYRKLEEDGYAPRLGQRESRAELLKELPAVYAEVTDRLQRAHEKNSRIYNLRRRPLQFQPGDVVWRKTFPQSDAARYFTAKLAPKYTRCVVHRRVSGLVYELREEDGRVLPTRWHVQDLKPDGSSDP